MARDDRADERGESRREPTRRETLRRGGAFGLGGLATGVVGTGTGSAAPDGFAPAVEWTRTYRTDARSIKSVADIARAPGGGFLFVGEERAERAVAASVDEEGCPRWIHAFEDITGEASAVAPTDDGGFVAGVENVDGPHLVRVGPSRDVAWTASFPEAGPVDDAEYRPRDVLPTVDGGYVVVGIHIYNDPVTWAAKVDADGRVAWSERNPWPEDDPIRLTPCGTFAGVAPAPADDDASYVVGWGLVGACDGGPMTPGLRGLTEDGTVAWTATYPGGLESLLFTRTADGGYALGGTNYGEGTVVVRKLRPDRTTEWVRAYESDAIPSASLIATPDGGLAFAGPDFSSEGIEVSVTRLSAAGDVRWRGAYVVDGRPANLRTLLRAPDGGFVFGGAVGFDRGERGGEAYLSKLEFTGDVS